MAETGPLQIKRGTTAKVNSVVPAQGEPVLDLTTMSLKMGDGVTAGGVPLNAVASAVRLATARTLSFTGDVTGSLSFDGSANATTGMSLADSGVAPGTYARVTIDAKGRATNGATVLPVIAGGTGATSAPAALAALGGAPLASPAFTGTPTAPTASASDTSTLVATTAQARAMAALFGIGTDTGPLMTDANAVTMGGMYRLNSNAANTPIASNAVLIQLNYNNGGAAQMFFPLGGAARAFWRAQASGSWTAWREVGGLDSPAFTGTPTAPTAAVGTSSTQLANTAMVQAEIANKRAWTPYTPTVAANSGTFTSATATGKYLVVFGICYVQITVTVPTKGTGALPKVSLPFAALAGSLNYIIPAAEASINGKLGKAVIIAGLTTALCSDYANADLITGDNATISICGSYPIA